MTSTAGWVSDPDTRGTFRLILSCLIILSLCVWSALHLNVPAPKESSLKRLGRKTLWVIMGVLAPEFVLFTAFSQWRVTTNATREWNKILERQRKAGQDP